MEEVTTEIDSKKKFTMVAGRFTGSLLTRRTCYHFVVVFGWEDWWAADPSIDRNTFFFFVVVVVLLFLVEIVFKLRQERLLLRRRVPLPGQWYRVSSFLRVSFSSCFSSLE